MWPAGLRAGSRRQLLCDDLLEQRRIGCTEGGWPGVHALLGKLGIARGIESRARLARLLDPGVELIRWHRAHLEMHAGETIAAIVARLAEEGAGPIGLQVQLRPHPVHRVDHAAELRD